MLKKTSAFLLSLIIFLFNGAVCLAVSEDAGVTLSAKEKNGKKGFYVTVDITSEGSIGAADISVGFDKEALSLKAVDTVNKLEGDRTDDSLTDNGARIIYITRNENVHTISLKLNFDYLSDKSSYYVSCGINEILASDGSRLKAGEPAVISISREKNETSVISEDSRKIELPEQEASQKSVPVLQSSFSTKISVPAEVSETEKSENNEETEMMDIVNRNEEAGNEKQLLIIGAGVLISFGIVGTALVLRKKNDKK